MPPGNPNGYKSKRGPQGLPGKRGYVTRSKRRSKLGPAGSSERNARQAIINAMKGSGKPAFQHTGNRTGGHMAPASLAPKRRTYPGRKARRGRV